MQFERENNLAENWNAIFGFFLFGRELSNISDDLLRGILHKMPFGTPNREKYMRKLEKLIFQHVFSRWET